ncbi:hypothetical protein GCM10023169_19920 [Georgenia halophila]|uniref:POTRA domain-containing protein n=1 Tax=Georgenia halophila TaxID=620889 RepID=A0ABP8L8L6_9MICO
MRPPAAPRRRPRDESRVATVRRRPDRELVEQHDEVVVAPAVPPTVTTGLAARLDERSAAARRLLVRRTGIAVATLAVLAAVAWVLLVSPLLAVEEDGIEVTGVTDVVDAGAVRAAVEPEVGTPLLRVDTAAAADRVRVLKGVDDVQVSRTWPDGLSVSVVPRVPVAAAPADDEGWMLLDRDGVQLGTRSEAPAELPQVTVPLDDSGKTAPALEAVLTVLGAVPEQLLEQIDSAGATSGERVTLELADGATVEWGSAEESELKAEVLMVLRQQPASVYDVSVPRAPTTSE